MFLSFLAGDLESFGIVNACNCFLHSDVFIFMPKEHKFTCVNTSSIIE